MELSSLLWQFFAFAIMTSFEIVTKVADELMFTLEDNDVYGKIVKVRNLPQGPDQVLR